MPRLSAGRVAWLATWRTLLLAGALLAVTVVPVALLLTLLLGFSSSWPLLAFAVLFPLSVFTHEWAHAWCAFRWCSVARSHGIGPLGGWRAAGILRPALPIPFDIVTTLAGPLAGVATAAPIYLASLAGGSPIEECLALMIPFTAHLLALAPIAPDGRAIIAAYRSLEAPFESSE